MELCLAKLHRHLHRSVSGPKRICMTSCKSQEKMHGADLDGTNSHLTSKTLSAAAEASVCQKQLCCSCCAIPAGHRESKMQAIIEL